MNITTLVSAVEIEDSELSILIDAAYTNQFYDFLRKKNTDCSPPSAAIFSTGRVYIDANGRKQIEEKILVNEIKVSGKFQDFEKWAAEWISTL